MSNEPTDQNLAIRGPFDEQLEGNIDLRPSDREVIDFVKEVVGLAIKVKAPGVGEIVKAVATIGGWLWQKRKAERAKEFLLGLYQRLERTRFEYVQKIEFKDLLEETLRRISEQPDDERRETTRKVFLKIVEEPREHRENKLLIRLCDELPADVLKYLPILNCGLSVEERGEDAGRSVLAARLGTTPEEVGELLIYLSNENLIDENNVDVRSGFAAEGKGPLLTPLALAFVEYMRG